MAEESRRNNDVFISYSSKDKKWADAACAVLERHRVRCWVAPRDITPGTEWGAAIINGMDASRIMVLNEFEGEFLKVYIRFASDHEHPTPDRPDSIVISTDNKGFFLKFNRIGNP